MRATFMHRDARRAVGESMHEVSRGQRVPRVTIMNARRNTEHVTRLINGLREEAQSLL